MLECRTAMAGAALLRLRLLYRMVRVGELLALVALLSWSSWYVPSAVAAALRLAGSLLLNARFVFLLGNAIVLLLFALSRHEEDDHLSSAASVPAGSSDRPAAASEAATTAQVQVQQVSSSSPVSVSVSVFVPPPTATAAAATTTATEPSSHTTLRPPASEEQPLLLLLQEREREREREREDKKSRMLLLVEANKNKQHKEKAPRRSRSGKMIPRRAASPELRRCESDNNGRRRRSSVSARDAEACSWGREDADEFRRQVEAFIARQTRFHREESIKSLSSGLGVGGARGQFHHCDPAPAFTGALAVVE